MRIEVVGPELLEYFVFISDPAAESAFQTPVPIGDTIKFEISSATKYVEYNIQLKETSVETNDGACADYPHNNHKSYSDCVNAEVRNKILPTWGCMPPWMSSTDQCSGPIQRLPEQEALFEWLFEISMFSWGGISYKSDVCLLPCTILTAHPTFQLFGYGDLPFNYIELFFEKNIQIEKVRAIYFIF